jgi:hypothetical protein
MTAVAHRPTALVMRGDRDAARRAVAARRFSLRASEDGWSLLAPDGEVVYRGFGLASRRECLEFARELGVLAVIS